MAHILLVDDDPGIRDLVAQFLHDNSHYVEVAGNAVEMDQKLSGSSFDIIVLDRMMPGEDGLSIIRRLDVANRPAIIMLSAMGAEQDRIEGLDCGADDYISKPCNPRELLARVNAIMRRSQQGQASAGHTVAHFHGWTFDLLRRELTSPLGVIVALSDGEHWLMKAFVESPNTVFTREKLLELARGREAEGSDRAIDVQVSRLRRKLEPQADMIQTIRHEGYLFAPAVEWR